MVFGLPAPGEPNWDVKLDASIEAVKTTADAAEAEIAGRLSESSLTASFAVKWKSGAAFTVGQLVNTPWGGVASVSTAHTAGDSYDSSKFTPIGPVDLVKHYGADATGGTDCSALLTAAVAAAGSGGTVVLNGKFLWTPTTGITVPASQTWIGPAKSPGSGGGGAAQISFPNIANGEQAVKASNGCLFERVFFKGPGSTTTAVGPSNGGSANATVTFTDCHFYDWGVGTQLDGSYYSVFTRCEWRRNEVQLDLINVCYNVNVVNPKMSCIYGGGLGFGTGIRADAVTGLKVFGGSIESFGCRTDSTPHAGILVTSTSTRSSISLFDVYFETAAAGGICVNIASTTNVLLRVHGGDVQLSNLEAFIYFPSATAGMVYTRGVIFFGTGSNVASPVAYLSSNSTVNTGVDIAGDIWAISGLAADWAGTLPVYDNGLAGLNKANVHVRYPATYAGSGATANSHEWMGTGVAVPLGKTFRVGDTHLGAPPIVKTSAYTLTSANSMVLADAASGAFTVTLPTAAGVSGQVYRVKKTDSSANAITIATTSSQTIDGAATKTLSTQWSTIGVISDGGNWMTL